MGRKTALLLSSLLLPAAFLSGCAGVGADDAGGSSPASEGSVAEGSVGGSAAAGGSAHAAAAGTEGAAMGHDVDASRVSASLNGEEFVIELAGNPTAQAFASLLPLEGEMSELNGNEKYLVVDRPLPSEPTNPGTIEAGDVMLYQSSYVVIFYETHNTGYAYTRIGRIADVAGLGEAVGLGSVDASFSALG